MIITVALYLNGDLLDFVELDVVELDVVELDLCPPKVHGFVVPPFVR